MTHIVILPLSLYVETKLQRSVDAFAAMGINKLSMLWNWFTLNAIFNRYRKADIDTDAFRDEIGKIYPKATVDSEHFDAAWNAMCEVTDTTKAAFEEVRGFDTKEVQVYFFSSTNPLHITHIKNQTEQGIPGAHFWSYEKKQLGSGLIEALLNEIHEKNPKIKPGQISFFYQPAGPAPLAKWGILGWLFAPFKRWEHAQKVKYVRALNKLESDYEAVKLVICNPSKPGNIKELVNQATRQPTEDVVSLAVVASYIPSLSSERAPRQLVANDEGIKSSRQRHTPFGKGHSSDY